MVDASQENQENPMTVYLVSYRDFLKDLAVSSFSDEDTAKVAAEATPGTHTALVVKGEDSLRSWGTKLLVGVFNALGPDGAEPVKRFENVATACRRTYLRIEGAKKTEPPAAPAAPATTEAAPAASTTVTPSEPAPAAADTTEDPMAAKRKRKSKSGGNGKSRPRIPLDAKIEVLVDENPKRKTAAAYERFALYKTGMLVKTFLEKGGTPADLSWDRAHKFIKIINP